VALMVRVDIPTHGSVTRLRGAPASSSNSLHLADATQRYFICPGLWPGIIVARLDYWRNLPNYFRSRV
jgi:hypothetical protein